MTAGLLATPESVLRTPHNVAGVRRGANLTPRLLSHPADQMDRPPQPTRTVPIRCTATSTSGRQCKMSGMRHGGFCAWHVPLPPALEDPVVMPSQRDRRMLGPVLARLRLWAAAFDEITLEAGDDRPLVCDFVTWLRVEIAPAGRAAGGYTSPMTGTEGSTSSGNSMTLTVSAIPARSAENDSQDSLNNSASWSPSSP